MVNSSQISEHAAMYLNGQIDVDAFEDWLISATWNMHLDSDADVMAIANEISEILGDFSESFIDESGLKKKLKDVLYSIKPQNVISINYSKPAPLFGWKITAQSESPDEALVWDSRQRIVQV